MATTKTLQGVIRITEGGDYNLVLPSNGARAQNDLAIYNIEEVFIIVEEILETTVNIYLPKISDFNGAWNTKIYILCKAIGGRFSNVYINSYSSETYKDFINQKDVTLVNIAGNTQFVHIVDNNYWLAK